MSMTSFIEKKNESEMKGFPWKDDVLGDLRARVLLMDNSYQMIWGEIANDLSCHFLYSMQYFDYERNRYMEMKNETTGFPSIDRPWLKYYNKEAIEASIPECTIYEYMYENNKNYPNDIALIYFNRRITYKELFTNIEKAVKAFVNVGVKKSDIVTVAMPSMPEALYCVYALNRIGAVTNMIHPLASTNEICHYLNEVNSETFVMFTGTYELIKNDIDKTSVKNAVVVSPADSLPASVRLLYKFKKKEPKFGKKTLFQSWNSFIKAGKGSSVKCESHDVNEMTVISHTGGTTGEPKGVMCSDRNINSVIVQVGKGMPHKRQERVLVVLPPFVNYSLVNGCFEPLSLGLTAVLIPDYQPQHFDRYIKKYRPNHINSIPAYCEAMLSNEKLKSMDLSCLKYYFYGGDSLSEKKEEEINKFLLDRGAKLPLGKGLGSTELVSSATATYPNCNHLGSVGIPLVKMNCMVVEPETIEELPINQEGELCITGPSLMLGYYKKPDATNDVIKIHGDGRRWLHTGDLGYITDDGIIYVTGRIKRIIMTKGNDGQVTKMFPNRIEKAILTHPAVSLCCVIGIEDMVRIHYPKAILVLNDEYEKSVEMTNEIIALCKKMLPDYMVPEFIEYRDSLPRTSRGKVDYRALETEIEGRK